MTPNWIAKQSNKYYFTTFDAVRVFLWLRLSIIRTFAFEFKVQPSPAQGPKSVSARPQKRDNSENSD